MRPKKMEMTGTTLKPETIDQLYALALARSTDAKKVSISSLIREFVEAGLERAGR